MIEDSTSRFIKILIKKFSALISDYALYNQAKMPFLVINDLSKYINENRMNNNVLKKINKLFNKNINSEYENISYLITTYFIDTLADEKLEYFNKISTGKMKKLIENFKDIKLKYLINNILAEWDPIDIRIYIKYSEYTSYVDKIISIGNNKVKIKVFLIHLVKDIIGLGFDEKNKNNEKDIDNVVENIIKLYE
jgi:hypothetical protein